MQPVSLPQVGKSSHEKLMMEALRQRLRRRQCVAFIGAGFSMPCGMPNWSGLIERLLKDAADGLVVGSRKDSLKACRQAVRERNFSMAASLLRKLMTPGDFDEAVRKQFGLHVLQQASLDIQRRMNARMKSLVGAPWAGVLTTNYDELIEHAIGRWSNNEVVKALGDDPRLGSILSGAPPAGMFFVKIHGSISGSRVVLSTDEYDRTYINTPQMISFLTALMLRYHPVFIGCSLEDEILRIRRKLNYDFFGQIPTAYALLPGNERNRHRTAWLREEAQIDSVFYPEDDKEHIAVDRFLKEAADCADHTDKQSLESITQNELLKAKPPERSKKIGQTNIQILELVSELPGHTIQHLDLLNPTRFSDDSDIGPTLSGLSPEERIYRALFLVSIGFLREEKGIDGAPRYVLTKDGLKALSTQSQKVALRLRSDGGRND